MELIVDRQGFDDLADSADLIEVFRFGVTNFAAFLRDKTDLGVFWTASLTPLMEAGRPKVRIASVSGKMTPSLRVMRGKMRMLPSGFLGGIRTIAMGLADILVDC